MQTSQNRFILKIPNSGLYENLQFSIVRNILYIHILQKKNA